MFNQTTRMQTMQRGFYEANSPLYSEYYTTNSTNNGYIYANSGQYYYEQNNADTNGVGYVSGTIPQGSGHTTIVDNRAEILYTSTDDQASCSPASTGETRETITPCKSPNGLSKAIYPWMTETRQNNKQKTISCGKQHILCTNACTLVIKTTVL